MKLFQAWRTPQAHLALVMADVARYMRRYVDLRQAAYNKIADGMFAPMQSFESRMRKYDSLRDLLAQATSKGLRNVFNTHDVLGVVVYEGFVYIHAPRDLEYDFHLNREIFVAPVYEDFHYQGITDRPREISQESWDARYDVWDAIFKSNQLIRIALDPDPERIPQGRIRPPDGVRTPRSHRPRGSQAPTATTTTLPAIPTQNLDAIRAKARPTHTIVPRA